MAEQHQTEGLDPLISEVRVYRVLLFENDFRNCTGHLLHRALIRVPPYGTFCARPITHINCLRIHFPITHTHLLHKRIVSELLCVIISGLIVRTTFEGFLVPFFFVAFRQELLCVIRVPPCGTFCERHLHTQAFSELSCCPKGP